MLIPIALFLGRRVHLHERRVLLRPVPERAQGGRAADEVQRQVGEPTAARVPDVAGGSRRGRQAAHRHAALGGQQGRYLW